MRKVIVYSFLNSFKLIALAESRVCGFRSFFECSIFFFWECEWLSMSSRKSSVYIIFSCPVVLCLYIISLTGFASLFNLVHPLASFKARFCGECLLSQSPGLVVFWHLKWNRVQNLSLRFLGLNSVYTGVTTDQLFFDQDGVNNITYTWDADISMYIDKFSNKCFRYVVFRVLNNIIT